MKLKIFITIAMVSLIGRCAALNGVSASSQSLDSVSTSLNSISTGLKSVSSISGSLASISGSSADQAEARAIYKMDVRDLTYFYATNLANSDWEKDMFLVARKNGILEWQSDRSSWEGIGEGLKKAGLSQKELEATLQEIKTTHPVQYRMIKSAYGKYEI